jgi:hypothetical protein
VLREEDERRTARKAKVQRASDERPRQGDAARGVGIHGITGSLRAYDVEQAMNKRQAELLACVEKRPRTLGHVAGDIAFHIDVDAQGKAERVLVMQSDLGYAPLEECLRAVVATAPFPAPAGAQRAETQWRMGVDPLQRPAEPIDTAELEDTLERHAEATYESCDILKRKRFLVHGYLGRKRKLHPVTVRTAWRGADQAEREDTEQLACLAQALTKWNDWPNVKKRVKVDFELRWVAAPPAPQKRPHKRPHKRARARRRR